MKTQIFEDYEAFLAREDKSINGVSVAYAQEHPNYEADNATNNGCWECVECERCDECIDCESCKDCQDCYNCKDCQGCCEYEDWEGGKNI